MLITTPYVELLVKLLNETLYLVVCRNSCSSFHIRETFANTDEAIVAKNDLRAMYFDEIVHNLVSKVIFSGLKKTSLHKHNTAEHDKALRSNTIPSEIHNEIDPCQKHGNPA